MRSFRRIDGGSVDMRRSETIFPIISRHKFSVNQTLDHDFSRAIDPPGPMKCYIRLRGTTVASGIVQSLLSFYDLDG